MKTRTGKQCRERYINHLDPNTKKTPWTLEENNVLRDMYPEFGSKWSKYMPFLPGRSDNCIKNRYHMISRNNFDCCSSIKGPASNKRTVTDAFRSISDAETNEDDLDLSEMRLNKLVAARSRIEREIVKLEEHCLLTKQASSSSKSTSSSDNNTPGKPTDIFSEYKFNPVWSGNNKPDSERAVQENGMECDIGNDTETILERVLRRA